LNSLAYRSLSLGARALLVELYALYNGQNNGDLYLSAREAGKRLGVGKTKAAACLHELEAKGFIRPRQRGAFQWKMRHATCWVLTEFAFAGQIPTKDFMRWQPPDGAKPGSPGGTDCPPGRTEPSCKVVSLPNLSLRADSIASEPPESVRQSGRR
jgi:hypothetical protein